MEIRSEVRTDEHAIDEVHRRAFANPGGNVGVVPGEGGSDGETEVRMVHDLRAGPTYLPDLSLVAVEDGTVVGHVLFTLVDYVPDAEPDGPVPILSLAPLGVRPERQNQGIGARLVDVGLRRASMRPEPFVVVLGHPRYYPRFGFTRASAHGIRCPFEGAPDEAYMVRRLPGFRPVATPGTVRYPGSVAR